MSDWVVPGYTEIRELGRGASGRVVLATDETTGRPVAIKYLTDDLCGDETFIREFRAEARILAEVDSPYVAGLYEYLESAGNAAIVMELIDGVSVRKMLREHGPIEAQAALVVLKGSLLGLAATHGRGVVHRDYKPDNVLVDGQGQSKLVDFGIAARAGRQDILTGTPSYMAPEQWAGGTGAPQTDIYAATATFFECLTGRPPYSAAGDLALLRRQHEQAPIPVNAAPEALRELLRRGLAKDPSHRPTDAASFLHELEAIASDAYGSEWEDEGRKQLARRALALALVFPLAVLQLGGTSIASTGFGAWTALQKAIVAGVATTVLIGGGVTGCMALNTRTLPTALVAPTTSHSGRPSERPSPSPSAVSSASTALSPSPAKTTTLPKPPPNTPSLPYPSPTPPPGPTLTGLTINATVGYGGACANPDPNFYCHVWNASAQVTGTGPATLHVRINPSADGTNPSGGYTGTWDIGFSVAASGTITWNNPASYATLLSTACNGDQDGWVLTKAWITVGVQTVIISNAAPVSCLILV